MLHIQLLQSTELLSANSVVVGIGRIQQSAVSIRQECHSPHALKVAFWRVHIDWTTLTSPFFSQNWPVDTYETAPFS